ncbi:MAG: hypothetical protein MJH09_08235 [Cetobacterium sp.]|nr:hypothetical protein [Cetobacterium sp.]
MSNIITSEWAKGLLSLGLCLAMLSIVMSSIKSCVKGKHKNFLEDKEVQITILNVFLIELLAILAYSLHQYDISMVILTAMIYSSVKSLHDCLYSISEKIIIFIKLKRIKRKKERTI